MATGTRSRMGTWAAVAAVAAAAVVAMAALALAGAAGVRRGTKEHCGSYPTQAVKRARRLLRQVISPPAYTRVNCSDKESACLEMQWLPRPDNVDSCLQLGMTCVLPKRSFQGECLVRADESAWLREGRLVARCVCDPPCPKRLLPVHAAGKRECVNAGVLACACTAAVGAKGGARRRGANLRPAPFGGYECASAACADDDCASQEGGDCTFPQLAVPSRVIHEVANTVTQARKEDSAPGHATQGTGHNPNASATDY